MILGWAQTQPSGRVVTHLHWVPGYRRRHTAAARLALARRRHAAAARLATVVATVVVGYYEATYYVATTNQATMRLLPGYHEATTRPNSVPISHVRGVSYRVSCSPGSALGPD